MKLIQISLAGALLMTGGAATAQSATDVGCIIVSNAFAKSAKDENARKTAEATVYFYLGRVRDGATVAQLKALFDQQAKTITDTNAGPMMNACVKGLQTKAELVQSLGGQQPAQQPPKK
jgi:hypothetical protein